MNRKEFQHVLDELRETKGIEYIRMLRLRYAVSDLTDAHKDFWPQIASDARKLARFPEVRGNPSSLDLAYAWRRLYGDLDGHLNIYGEEVNLQDAYVEDRLWWREKMRDAFVARTNAGWVRWAGGEMPEHLKGKVVQYKMRYQERPGRWHQDYAADLRWTHGDWGGDIIAYRVVDEKPQWVGVDLAKPAETEAEMYSRKIKADAEMYARKIKADAEKRAKREEYIDGALQDLMRYGTAVVKTKAGAVDFEVARIDPKTTSVPVDRNPHPSVQPWSRGPLFPGVIARIENYRPGWCYGEPVLQETRWQASYPGFHTVTCDTYELAEKYIGMCQQLKR